MSLRLVEMEATAPGLKSSMTRLHHVDGSADHPRVMPRYVAPAIRSPYSEGRARRIVPSTRSPGTQHHGSVTVR
jgi:hypothetical protein